MKSIFPKQTKHRFGLSLMSLTLTCEMTVTYDTRDIVTLKTQQFMHFSLKQISALCIKVYCAFFKHSKTERKPMNIY